MWAVKHKQRDLGSWEGVVSVRRLCCNWLIGCFGFNDPLRLYFSLYRAVSQREGKKEET